MKKKLASFKTYEFICGASTAAGCAARAREHFGTCAQARARAREQKDMRARGARATRDVRTWCASKNKLAREQGARTHKRARARVLRRSRTNSNMTKRNVKTVYVRVRSQEISNQASSSKSFSPWFAAMISGRQAHMETWMLMDQTKWTTGTIHQSICICYQITLGHVKNHHWLLLALETFMTDMFPVPTLPNSCLYPVTCSKPSAGAENEAKCGLIY